MSKKYQITKSEFEEDWFILHIDDAKNLGYIPYSKPCKTISEANIIQNMINDILRNGRDKYCVVKYPGYMAEVWIIPNRNQDHPRPYVYLESEEE